VDDCSKRRNRDNSEGSASHNSELRTMSAESPSSVRKGTMFLPQSIKLFPLFFFLNLFFLSLAVVVHLRATGDAPILKQSKFKVFPFLFFEKEKFFFSMPIMLYLFQILVCGCEMVHESELMEGIIL